MDNYRAPTPRLLAGATTITTAELIKLLQQEPVLLVDVLAVTYRAESALFDGAWLLSEPRANLPHSLWLPNVGYGIINSQMQAYFSDNLAKATQGNKNHPIVFYCIVDCWMSWNASKRALTMGYTRIYWYPEGTDGWKEAGQTLENSIPVPLSME
ncbi:PQQ-dependent catabolism-associated CXXCW motif protein [Beggiatoa leptomitoformis]|uniref:PQQ-dependent catabolism-associated CXXCW motif protein n=2 Tax=Beggiatoa leptomitoformis TaxID=288004 RepID=A0A2N9YFA8_9GAMM|nr:PQQ-dependent catabolism-associated CXXCW motif protein [Beggiatoa leptomitoformis]AUI69157.1 PQQ-dependent catabolism-associated CXXCW motif protein [Beggiatoa leptomitoformis]